MSAFDSYVQAAYHGGVIPDGPTFTVIHDAETPLDLGYADSIAGFFQRGPTAGTSAHAMVGPEKAIKMLPDNVVAWAAGPMANSFGWHCEQSGYARFTRADWTTPKGMAQLARMANVFREIHATWKIPVRWVTDAQLRAAARGDRSQGGITTHQQIARVLGGTTHTDPETNYPRDLLLAGVLGQGDDDFMALYNDRSELRTDVYNATWVNAQWTVPGTDRQENPGQFLSATRVVAVQAAQSAASAAALAKVAAEGAGITQAQIDQIVHDTSAQVAKDLAVGFDLQLTPKPSA